MTTIFTTTCADFTHTVAFSESEIPGIYPLAFRDLTKLIEPFAAMDTAMDLGCGAGRSTRFVKSPGYETTSLDDLCAKERK